MRRVGVRKFHSSCFQWGPGSERPAKLTASVRQALESHWGPSVATEAGRAETEGTSAYVVPMFPYPSGSLHLGHVRVYTLSDAIARVARLRGRRVRHPIGWDAFGLPAENAAIHNNRDPAQWTNQNIAQMKGQLQSLGCHFDWDSELRTCDPSYYRWTQWLFVRLWKAGLVRWGVGSVKWDPVDATVVAEEQIDAEGRAWRSGAVVEERLLPQWTIRTTRFAKALRDSLQPQWGDVAKIQAEWIGPCDVYRFHLPLRDANGRRMFEVLDLSLVDPGQLPVAERIFIKADHFLAAMGGSFEAWNPVSGAWLPIEVSSERAFGLHLDAELGVRPSATSTQDGDAVISAALEGDWGGYAGSRKLRDWVVSRQRYWGTPIPLVHCGACGPTPVPEGDLPLVLPKMDAVRPSGDLKGPLAANLDWINTTCPSCGGPAQREADTLDTLMDSSWYFMRYLDAKNETHIFDPEQVNKWLPVDAYVGGIEHASVHLFYARFMHHFLHSVEGLVDAAEPFHRLLTQGMVRGQTRVHSETAQILRPDEVAVGGGGELTATADGAPVLLQYEKMSKSKFNGADPLEVVAEMGIDGLRVLLFSSVNPRDAIDWDSAGSVGVDEWLWRIWKLVERVTLLRSQHEANPNTPSPSPELEVELKQLRNNVVAKATFHVESAFLFHRLIEGLKVFTLKLLKRSNSEVSGSLEWERCVRALVLMVYPLAPHVGAELWSALSPGAAVWTEAWPTLDPDSTLAMRVILQRGHWTKAAKLKLSRSELGRLKEPVAVRLALANRDLAPFLSGNFVLHTELDKTQPHEAKLFLVLETF